MKLRLVFRYFGFFLFSFSLALLFWGLRKTAYQTRSVGITQADLSLSVSEADQGHSDSNTIIGSLNLEWPISLRHGDAGVVRLSFVPEPTRRAEIPPDLIMQSRLGLAGIARTPTGVINQALMPDHPITFLWNLRPNQTGSFTGEVWLHVQSSSSSMDASQSKVVFSQQFSVSVTSLLGLSGLFARIIGGVGLIIGMSLGFGDRMTRWFVRSFIRFNGKEQQTA